MESRVVRSGTGSGFDVVTKRDWHEPCLDPLVAMACLSTVAAAQMQLLKVQENHSDVESTVANEHSDIETVEDSCPSAPLSPRSSGTADACEDEEGEGPCNVVVRGTFLDLNDGQGLMQRYGRLRRSRSESALAGAFDAEEAYLPGKFSDERAACAKAQASSSSDLAQEAEAAPAAPAAAAAAVKERKGSTKQQAERTTVMLRNVPNNYTREMFLAMLDEHGFAGRYDFVYLPCDFYRQANLGYAFVNLVDGAAVEALWKTFDGFASWALPTAKVCQLRWSGPHQGFKAPKTHR